MLDYTSMMRLMNRVLLSLTVAVALLASGLATAASRADQTDPRLPALFTRLHDTDNANIARLTELMIWQIWGESGDPKLDKLMREGEDAMEAEDFKTAEARLTTVIKAKPDFAEGWNRRATMYFLRGDYAASLADIEHVLELEPRHFGAISGLGVVNIAQEHLSAARDAFERVLSLYPTNIPAQENLKSIKKKLDESDI